MKKDLFFLGIETSCDETAASIVQKTKAGKIKILSNIVSSQHEVHKKFGGVVPDLAARAHSEKVDIIIQSAIKKSGIEIKQLDGIATTAGPGLLVCLMVGMSAGKTLASFLKKPFYGINHLEGHALTMGLIKPISFPFLLLLISGGHSQFLSVEGIGKYKRLGTTIDDALGEAFDKTAKLIGIEFPGGPQIEKLAKKGNKERFDLPKPIFNRGGCNLSFAGLKTAILKISKNIKNEQDKSDIAASFQNTIEQIMYKKTNIAFDEYEKINNSKNNIFVIAGGVAANKNLREMFKKICNERDFKSNFPPIELCGDNAAMIGLAGLEKYKSGLLDELNFPAKPRWQLDEKASFLKGAGVKI